MPSRDKIGAKLNCQSSMVNDQLSIVNEKSLEQPGREYHDLIALCDGGDHDGSDMLPLSVWHVALLVGRDYSLLVYLVSIPEH